MSLPLCILLSESNVEGKMSYRRERTVRNVNLGFDLKFLSLNLFKFELYKEIV